MSSDYVGGAVVTGAASGIGRAIAAGLRADGFSVVIADLDEVKGRAVAKEIAAANGGPLSEDDQHILDMWGTEGSPSRLLDATDEIRFQLGQSDRFRAGLIRSGAWETHIAETLANLGLPAELAVLPHVESSFNPAAYSKVGAAGLWQFMRSTGRRYMRIDNAVDDRLDPFRSTEAAAQLLSYNYRLLGSWPLAQRFLRRAARAAPLSRAQRRYSGQRRRSVRRDTRSARASQPH